jgi:predicted phosphate transport protein (TIGR00153 family)
MDFPNPFRSRGKDFLKELGDQALKTREGLEALEAFLKDGDEAQAKRVQAIEKEADELRRILIDDLNRTFVTPIDREDLFALSRTIDDVLDYGYTTLDEMVTLGVQPNTYLQRLVSILREAADELYLGVIQLKAHPQVALDHATRAKALENRAESVYRSAVGDLFKEPKTVEDIVEILKMREIYRHLSNAADRGDEAANILGDIVVKMT